MLVGGGGLTYLGGEVNGHVCGFSEVRFAGAERGDGVDQEELVGLGNPEGREAGVVEVLHHGGGIHLFVGVEDDEAFAALGIGDADDEAGRVVEDLLEALFHFQVRHHFPADFGEAGEAAGDVEEAIVVQAGHIAGVVVAVDEHFLGSVRLFQVAAHTAGAFH